MNAFIHFSRLVLCALYLVISATVQAEADPVKVRKTSAGLTISYGYLGTILADAVRGKKTCSPLRVTPADGVDSAFTNSQISVAYTSERPGVCADVRLLDANGKVLPTTRVYRSEWVNPLGGFVGSVTLEPLNELLPGTRYEVLQAFDVVGRFATSDIAVRRGVATEVKDQIVDYRTLPKAAVISAKTINTLFATYVQSVVKDPRWADIVYDTFSEEAPHLANPQATYSARVKRVSYTSSRADGSPIELSGLLIYPENADGSPFDYAKAGLLMGQHGRTKAGRNSFSSAATSDVLVGLLAAGKGHVFFAPDLIGFGNSAGIAQAYLITQDTGTASQDMLLAVRSYFAARFPTTPLGRDLRIVGGSQGGFSAVAVMPFLSRLADIKGVYAGAGPYNIRQTVTSVLEASAGQPRDAYSAHENLGFAADYLTDILNSYRAYEGFSYNDADVFNGKTMNANFVQDFSVNPRTYRALYAHLGLNTLVDNGVVYNAPAAEVMLFHHSNDNVVPAQNTVDMLRFLNNGTHTLRSASRGDCKENSSYSRLFVFFSGSLSKSAHSVCSLYLLEHTISAL